MYIFENPYPCFDIRKPGSLNGKLFHGVWSDLNPIIFYTPLVHDAQNNPFAVNIGSSSVPSPLSDMKRS